MLRYIDIFEVIICMYAELLYACLCY